MVSTVSFHEMSTDCRIFMLSNALMKVSGYVSDIICIAQITRETINNAIPISLGLRICPDFLLTKTSCNVGRISWLRSRNCFRAACFSSHLIFEWKVNSYCATIIGVSFRCAYRSISRRLKIDRNLTHSALKASVVDDRA